MHRASLDVLLATLVHIPLSPAKEVKKRTHSQKEDPPTQLQPQGQKNEKFHYEEVLGDPHTVQACYPHFSQPFSSPQTFLLQTQRARTRAVRDF